MRKLVLIVVVVLVAGAVILGYPSYVTPPARSGAGPLAITLDGLRSAPEYHSPLPWWQTHHMDMLNRGDLAQSDCFYCHEPQTSCNNCHSYVGVKEVYK